MAAPVCYLCGCLQLIVCTFKAVTWIAFVEKANIFTRALDIVEHFVSFNHWYCSCNEALSMEYFNVRVQSNQRPDPHIYQRIWNIRCIIRVMKESLSGSRWYQIAKYHMTYVVELIQRLESCLDRVFSSDSPLIRALMTFSSKSSNKSKHLLKSSLECKIGMDPVVAWRGPILWVTLCPPCFPLGFLPRGHALLCTGFFGYLGPVMDWLSAVTQPPRSDSKGKRE